MDSEIKREIDKISRSQNELSRKLESSANISQEKIEHHINTIERRLSGLDSRLEGIERHLLAKIERIMLASKRSTPGAGVAPEGRGAPPMRS